MISWFDPETGLLRLDELAAAQPSFKKILADGEISDDELYEQSNHVIKLLHRLDQELDHEQHNLVTELLSEMAVLFEISQYNELQKLKQL